MSENNELFKAIADLREIRWAVDRARESSRAPQLGSLKTHLAIQVLAIVLFTALAAYDFFVHPSLTDFLILTFSIETFRILFVFLILATLIGLCCAVYLIVWRAARRANEPVSGYITRNFNYLSVASFSSDLFVKFSAIALVILARRPDWVPGILVACIGDYLIQGRGFVLPVRVGLVWGMIYLLFSVYIILWLQGDLWYACTALVLPAIASAVHITRLQNRTAAEAE